MWRGLYVNKDGCYLHDTNKPTSKTENMSDNRKKKKKQKPCQDKLSVVDKLKYDM